jgi:hypothetical protein
MTAAALPGAWHLDAACRCQTATMTLPDTRGHRVAVAVAKAKAICAVCPVIAECRAWALTLPDPAAWHGGGGGMVAGGLTPKERTAERTGTRYVRVSHCGSTSSYYRHFRNGEQPCRACLDAYNAAATQRRRDRQRPRWGAG